MAPHDMCGRCSKVKLHQKGKRLPRSRVRTLCRGKRSQQTSIPDATMLYCYSGSSCQDGSLPFHMRFRRYTGTALSLRLRHLATSQLATWQRPRTGWGQPAAGAGFWSCLEPTAKLTPSLQFGPQAALEAAHVQSYIEIGLPALVQRFCSLLRRVRQP